MAYPAFKHFLASASAPLHRQPKENELPQITPPKASDRILLLSPHPDDETIFAGGYLATAAKTGATIRLCLITDGNHKGHYEERLAEFRQATTCLGISEEQLAFYLLPDGTLEKSSILALKIQAEIAEFEPTIVLTPHPGDSHSDHSALGLATLKAKGTFTLLQYLAHFPPSFPRPRRHLPAARLAPPPALQTENWHEFVIPPKAREQKWEALQAYQRELETKILRSLILAFDRVNELYVVQKPAS